jgi:hypothetical protein
MSSINKNASQKLCISRALHNARYLQGKLPKIFPEGQPITDIIPLAQLRALHMVNPDLIENKEVANLLSKTKIPLTPDTAQGPLFSGTLYFVQITFNYVTGGWGGASASFTINTADVQTALQYGTLAANPISRYATQYGTNSLSVSPNIIPFTANLSGSTYTDGDLQGWIENICSSNGLTPNSSCIIVLNSTQGPINSDGDPGNGIGGYHQSTSPSNVPYCFCNVFGTNLTVDDSQNAYAQILSHEVAEMTVDPFPNVTRNPEVCDACAPNCGTTYFDFFDESNTYLGSGTDLSNPQPAGFSWNYFINSIVAASYNLDGNGCITAGTAATACEYDPASPPPPPPPPGGW